MNELQQAALLNDCCCCCCSCTCYVITNYYSVWRWRANQHPVLDGFETVVCIYECLYSDNMKHFYISICIQQQYICSTEVCSWIPLPALLLYILLLDVLVETLCCMYNYLHYRVYLLNYFGIDTNKNEHLDSYSSSSSSSRSAAVLPSINMYHIIFYDGETTQQGTAAAAAVILYTKSSRTSTYYYHHYYRYRNVTFYVRTCTMYAPSKYIIHMYICIIIRIYMYVFVLRI